MSEITNKELSKIIYLYKNSKLIENYVKNQNIRNLRDEEFYLVNKEWIDKFKKVFKYNNVIQTLHQSNIDLEHISDEKISAIKVKEEIKNEDRKNLQIINNKPINISTPIPHYLNFVLIHHSLYDKITHGYIINEKIKADICISHEFFVIKLKKSIIEIGHFNKAFEYHSIYLIEFINNENYLEEINNIFLKGLYQYLSEKGMKNEDFQKSGELSISNIKLINIYKSEENMTPMNINNSTRIELTQNQQIIPSDNLDISNKNCFSIFDSPDCSRLNAIIQLLTSIKEIYDKLNDKKENELNLNNTIAIKENELYKKFNHIYILTSFFQEALNEVYKNEKKNISLKNMDIILHFLDIDCSKKDLYNYLLLILQSLHNELIQFPDNLNQENLISFNSAFAESQTSYYQFINYYESMYKKSIISDSFNWMRKESKMCSNCELSSFQTFPMIQFDLAQIQQFLINDINNINNQFINKNSIIDLSNCFECYSKISYPGTENCQFCKSPHNSIYYIQFSPKYLLIVIKNNKHLNLRYPEKFDIRNYVSGGFPYYNLMGVVLKEEGKFNCLLKDENINKWKKFSDDQKQNIDITGKNYSEIFHPVNSRILLYKGVQN